MQNNYKLELSIVMPCLNEAETLKTCIEKAHKFIKNENVNAEVIIADNGSEDGSQDIARQNGARVVSISRKGYGAALMGGIKESLGEYIIVGDADDSYDFINLKPYLEKLRDGFDLVMGNRYKGGIKKGAMPFLHKYLGTPVLSFLGRIFFKSKIRDFNCGLRGFRKESYDKMGIISTGMEFASEMIVKSALLKMKVTEVPTTLSPDGRSRAPHLKTWRDGWRHLRFLLMFSPRWLFLYPGIFLIFFGLILSGLVINATLTIGELNLDIHSLLYFSGTFLVGFQFVFFFAFTKTFAISSGLLPDSPRYKKIYKYFNLERGLLAGAVLIGTGVILTVIALMDWAATGFGELIPTENLRIVIPAVTFLILGTQIVLYSFFLSILGLKK